MKLENAIVESIGMNQRKEEEGLKRKRRLSEKVVRSPDEMVSFTVVEDESGRIPPLPTPIVTPVAPPAPSQMKSIGAITQKCVTTLHRRSGTLVSSGFASLRGLRERCGRCQKFPAA